MTKSKKTFILIASLIVLILAVIGISFLYPEKEENAIDKLSIDIALEKNEIDEDVVLDIEPKQEDIVITIAAVGDVMAHESQLIHDYNDDPDIYDFKPTFEKIAPTIRKADFAIANLETTISGDSFKYSGYPNFNTPISFVDALLYSGIDMVTLANNHTLDMGEVGIKNTISNLDSKNMDHTGLSTDEKGYYNYYLKDINGIKIAVIAYSWRTSAVRKYENKDYIQRFWDDVEGVEKDIKAVKNLGAEVVVLSVHWGTEYRRSYTIQQRRLAETYIGLGADIILGSHPHVVEPIERLLVELEDGSFREGIVAYSMGNFISNMKARYNNTGIVVNIKIRKTPDGETIIDPITYVPTLIRSTRIYNMEASNHEILPAGKYISDYELFESLSEDDKEKITLAYNDLVELIDAEHATPLNE